MDGANRPVALVCAADDRYAMPLAVTLRSALDGLAEGRTLRVFVIDGGIQPRRRERLLASLDPRRCDVEFLVPDPQAFKDAVVTPGHVSVASYYRIAAPWLLPADLTRVIYLDSDLVVRGDLAALFATDLKGQPLAAAVDTAVPSVSAPLGLRNYRALGLAPDVPYFNAGVLVLDLARWRRERIPERAFDYLAAHIEVIRFWDQDVLNAVLAGDFRALDPRWNQLPDVAHHIREEPWIVHFASTSKPWQVDCDHPRRDLFFEILDRTAWAGWRPRRTLRDTRAVRAVTRVQRRVRARLSRRVRC